MASSSFPPEGAPLDTAVLFVDLVNSSTFASVMDLKEYAEYMQSFHDLCLRQCSYYFEIFLKSTYVRGKDYSIQIAGDELLVFMHSDRAQNDVYQLTCLAIVLKAAWIASPVNQRRIERRAPVAEISAGIHHGPLWAVPKGDGLHLTGYGINVAKRVESLSRQGEHYRIFLSDQAYKRIHYLVRNLLFTPRLRFEVRGILGDIGMHEVAHSFVGLLSRMDPHFATAIRPLLVDAITLATQDLWMHDLFQVLGENEHGRVSNEAMDLCRRVLRHAPNNPSALYYLALGNRERGDVQVAVMLLRELNQHWPHFADGYLELGRLLATLDGERSEIISVLRRAHYLGALEALDEISKLANSDED